MIFKLVNINIAIFMKKKIVPLLYLTLLCIMVTMVFLN